MELHPKLCEDPYSGLEMKGLLDEVLLQGRKVPNLRALYKKGFIYFANIETWFHYILIL